MMAHVIMLYAEISSAVIASKATKQSILSFRGGMDCFRLRSLSYGGQVASHAMTRKDQRPYVPQKVRSTR
jgi:hypothetical protein